MVVLTAMTASLYAAILIPFKVLPIIPGVTELRPANAIPIVCSFLFGPAAAWGAAIGNVIGDFFGGIGPGDLFGFVGNFLYGLLPYLAWEALTDADPVPRDFTTWSAFSGVVLLASAACALTVGWGINLLGFVPFSVLGNIVLINDFLVAVALAPFLLIVIYPRVKRAQLLYRDIMRPAAYSAAALETTGSAPEARTRRRLGLGLAAVATITGMIMGNLLSTGQLTVPWIARAGLTTTTHAAEVGFGLLPSFILLLVGVALM